MFNIEEELKKLPGKPGVYLMHDAKDANICRKGNQSEEQSTAVFSAKQKCFTKD